MSSQRTAHRGVKLAILWAALAIAYLVVFWRRLLIDGLVPLDGDMMRLVYPTWSVGNLLFARSLLPLWDSYRNMGCPFLAHPPNQVLYPLHRIFSTTHFLDYMRLYVVAHILVAAVPSYLLARRWKLSMFGGVLAVLAVCFNGFVLTRVTTTIDFASYAWAPMALYALSLRKPGWLATVLAVQWFAGFPTFSLMTGLLLVVAAVTEEEPRAALKCLFFGGITSVALASVQVLPFFDLLIRSARPVLLSSDFALQYGLHPKELFRPLFVPSIFLNRMPPVTDSDVAVVGFYIGPFLAALAAASAILGKKRERIMAGAALACFALTLGSRFPLYRFIPGITLFRFPALWLFPAVILTAFLAAGAIDLVRAPVVRGALLAIVAADLLIFAWPPHVAWAEPAILEQRPRELSLLGPEIPAGRVFFEPALIDLSSKWRLSTMDDWKNMISIGLPSIEAGYGIREIASRHQLAVATQVAFVKRLAASSLGDPAFDYAGVTTIVRLPVGVNADPPPELFKVEKNPHAKGEVFFLASGRVIQLHGYGQAFTIEAEGPGRLVLSESYDRSWRASIDGAAVDTESFEAAFPTVMVPAGRHIVRFDYRPREFVVGAVISISTILVLIGLLLSGTGGVGRFLGRLSKNGGKRKPAASTGDQDN